ncbi:UNVERIFIED_CONTAM: hypothetical protein PYX00_002556 [Menopon gallinae]|uniref:Scavenger receptor class B member 1 n=1 Tax=Menopon gallinae TaxID=328185 RepID=A0AAW2IIK1_9NEOP
MGLHKQYLRVGQNAKNRLFGIPPSKRNRIRNEDGTPINMLISEQGKISTGRLIVIVLGLFTLALGIVLSSIPWLDYLILKHLRLSNGSLSYHYWQRPGVVRLTKVYVFNITNPEGFLENGEKPKLVEVGPFVYREDMEKVNIKFHNNGTVTFQHNKILKFVPELTKSNRDQKVTVPNIPLLSLAAQGEYIYKAAVLAFRLFRVNAFDTKPFVTVTPEELMFGYEDGIMEKAHKFSAMHLRPPSKMALLIGRNGTLNEVSTIYTGHTNMTEFGLINRINGLDHLSYWKDSPCNSIKASEGSFFPPRKYTKSDIVHVYDKDLCRILPLRYRRDVFKHGIKAGYYTPTDDALESADKNKDNKCFCPKYGDYCPPKGLQNVNPCHFYAPLFLSYPHFYQAEPSLLDDVEGLKPIREKHETYFKIQDDLGVPLEGFVRVQLNLKVPLTNRISLASKFRGIILPVMWLEEGIEDLTPAIQRWIYLATTFSGTAVPVFTYGFIVLGAVILVSVFVRAYRNLVFPDESLEIGREMLTRELRELRRGSSFIINNSPKLLILRDSYTLLNNINGEAESDGTNSRV